MHQSNSCVLIGNFPPPVHGNSKNVAAIAYELGRRMEVVPCDVSPGTLERGFRYHFTKLRKQVRAVRTLLMHAAPASRIKVLYVVPDHGLGGIYNIVQVLIARRRRFSIVMHHRTFSYVTNPSRLMRTIVRASGEDAAHIFLCDTMAEKFRGNYPVRHFRVISNLAMLPHQVESRDLPDSEWFTLGLLSNLSAEKGLHVFLEVLGSAIRAGQPVRGLLGGPANDKDARLIERAKEEFGAQLNWLGLVAPRDKGDFYRRVDLFLFPTCYQAEAQPNVVFEAMQAGCLVLTSDIGCLPGDIGSPVGKSVPLNSYVEEAAHHIASLIREPGQPSDRAMRKADTQRRAVAARTQYESCLDDLASGKLWMAHSKEVQ